MRRPLPETALLLLVLKAIQIKNSLHSTRGKKVKNETTEIAFVAY